MFNFSSLNFEDQYSAVKSLVFLQFEPDSDNERSLKRYTGPNFFLILLRPTIN